MSEEKSREPHHVEDLSVLSRRGALSAAEQRAFTEALDASATLAAAHQLGLDFDQIATVRPGDDTLIAQVAARAVTRASTRTGGRRRLHGLLLVAAMALAGTATAWWQRGRRAAAVGSPTVTPAGTSAAHAAPRPADPMPQVAPKVAAEARDANSSQHALRGPSAPNSPGPANGRIDEPSGHVDEPSARTFDSAESLFREANAARRSGDSSSARALYLRLEHDFPASDEAHLAHVSLGNLLLAMGLAAEAERQFASYLGGRPALAQEALVGRAQSLATLGRGSEEQRVWQSLLHDYPSSVYAERAKLRLAELARSIARPD